MANGLPPFSLPTGLNRLLAAIPPADFDRLKRVRFGVRDVVYLRGGRIDHVYFPLSGVFSVLVVMENGDAVEVTTVGREGMLGDIALLEQPAPARSRCSAR